MSERGAGSLLLEGGVRAGHRIAVLGGPEPSTVAFLLAASRTEALVSPLNPRWTAPELDQVLEVLRPHTLVVGAGIEPPGCVPERAIVRAADLGMEAGGGAAAGGGERDFRGKVRAKWVLWTSGTTGEPRGIVLGPEAFLASGRASALRLGLGRSDRWLASLEPAHVGGIALLLRANQVGSQTVALGSFDPEVVSRAVDRGEVTHASLVPTQLLRVLEERNDRPFPPSFRTLLLGGAPTPRALLERALAARIPVALTWGMTEAASQVATAPPPLVRAKPGTVGPPLDGTEVQVTDDGELRVRGPGLARGIFRGPDVPPEPLVGPFGWYRTGDAGSFDSDGDLWITGRISDRIVTGGVTVEPGEVEAVLGEHPAVREAAVVGVPDDRWGERIVAVVAPVDPAAPPTLEVLLTHTRPRLSAAKLPRELRILRSLPRTPTGKVDRRALVGRLERP